MSKREFNRRGRKRAIKSNTKFGALANCFNDGMSASKRGRNKGSFKRGKSK